MKQKTKKPRREWVAMWLARNGHWYRRGSPTDIRLLAERDRDALLKAGDRAAVFSVRYTQAREVLPPQRKKRKS